MTLTSRQYVALHLYFVRGATYREIGKVFGMTSSASPYDLVQRGRNALIRTAVSEGANMAIQVRELLRPSPNASLTRDLGKAASRQDALLDELEQRMLQRADELADIEQCMSGKSILPVRVKRNHFDQWECRYLNGSGVLIDPIGDEDLPFGWHMEPRRKSRVPESMYRAGKAANYCAAPVPCSLTPRCVGCPHD